jgi:hypothetical protein
LEADEMGQIRTAYLDAARSALALLGDPAVAAAWDAPSALAEFQVSGLAGHLAYQILSAPTVLSAEGPDSRPIALLDHYARAPWVLAGVEAEANVNIRRGSDALAASGIDTLAADVAAVLDQLADVLPKEPADRVVYLPWTSWSLTLDDFLTTRMMEIAVHSDDLAVSVSLDAPPLPDDVLAPVLGLLSSLAVRRHGQAAVLRALSRAERAPATIAAI